jgi:uncharacterized protein (DUF433 family)
MTIATVTAHRTPVTSSYIELDDSGRPWIVGANTKVIEVASEKVFWGWDPEQMHRQHPHLSLAQLHAALAWYYDHQAEMDAEIRQQQIEFDRQRQEFRQSPQGQRMLELKARRSAT